MLMALLAVIIVVLSAVVVIAIFLVLWRARTSARQSRIAVASLIALTAWAAGAAIFARHGLFQDSDLRGPPPVGIALGMALLLLAVCLGTSPSLRALLTNQRHLILLNLWRLVGAIFLILMARGRMPAVWALPAGIGDMLVGALAPWAARNVHTPEGRRRAILFNVFGMADLVVAVGLGIMTNPGPLQLLHTTPTSELATRFPLALVPTFLVPLAFVLHVVSIWQLLGGSWGGRHARRPFFFSAADRSRDPLAR